MSSRRRAASSTKTGKASKSSKRVPRGLKSTFLGPAVPQEVRDVVPLLHDLDASVTTKTCSTLCEHFQSSVATSATDVSAADYAALRKETKLPAPEFAALFTGMLYVLRSAVRQRVKGEKLSAELTAMNVPPAHAAAIVDAVLAQRAALELGLREKIARFPRLTSFRWRVDVCISTSKLLRVMQPSVLMKFEMSNGLVKVFECSPAVFSQLRFNVAKLLKLMLNVEAHPIMKIIDGMDRQRLKADAK